MEKEKAWASSNKEEERNDSYFQQNNTSQPVENLLWMLLSANILSSK